MATAKVTLAAVNKRLAELGVEERLVKSKGYFYFSEGDAMTWPQSGVYGVGSVDGLSIAEWIKEYENLSGKKIEEPTIENLGELTAERFPIFTAHLNEKQRASFVHKLALINAAIAAGKIANPDYEDMKSFFNNRVEGVWKDYAIKSYFDDAPNGNHQNWSTEMRNMYWDARVYSLHDCKSAIKRVNKAKTDEKPIHAMRAVLKELQPLVVAMDHMKSIAVKRQLKSEEDREAERRYVPPPTASAAEKKIHQLLINLTNKSYEGLVEWFVKDGKRTLKTYMGLDKKERRDMYAHNPDCRDVIDACVENTYTTREETVRANAAELIRGVAERNAKRIQEMFVFKNLKKLASVVDGKGDLKEAVAVDSSISLAGLRGTLHFTFEDGAHFTVDNNIVWSTSVHGRQFVRFPLTFHNVYLGDGSKMLRPSEEAMNTIFAKKPTPSLSADEKKQFARDAIAAANDQWSPEGGDWRQDEAFPLKELGDKQEWLDWFAMECAQAEEQGNAGIYDDLADKKLPVPEVIILVRDGKPEVLAGHHHVGAALRANLEAVPALVGKPLPEHEMTAKSSAPASGPDLSL